MTLPQEPDHGPYVLRVRTACLAHPRIAALVATAARQLEDVARVRHTAPAE